MADVVVIVAGGKGLRMGGDLPKQFMLLAGKPVLMHTVEKFYRWKVEAQIVIVLPKEQHLFWNELCQKHSFNILHKVVEGGSERFFSVRNGLQAIDDSETGCVAIHDGVRPFVTIETIERCFNAARQVGAAIPIVPVVETLRRIDGCNVNRKEYCLVQTPQVFDIQLIKAAYQQDYKEQFTDDASVVEAMGKQVATVDGNRENIKLTTPFDMAVGELLAQKQN